MNYADHIHTDPAILGGKPIIRGTRMSVELILELLAAGWSIDQIKDEYPFVTDEALRAIFALAHELVTEERFIIESKVA